MSVQPLDCFYLSPYASPYQEGVDLRFALPPVALAALRAKKNYEAQLDRLAGTRMTLEAQVSIPSD